MRRSLLASCAAAAALLAATRGAAAETLADALADAYNNNPQLLAERALLRATDENVPQALAGWRPTVQVTGDVGIEHLETRATASPAFPGETGLRPSTVDFNVAQPIYSGGRPR